ncbi:MAG: HAD-IA family hydrolase [Tannerellaceae bacterium]|nr:HAD-IA family hydrolase [Tannerellaceae bacterium]
MIREAIEKYLQKHNYSRLEPKAVLFDMDGVLYDSMRFHARAWQETASSRGLISTPEDFYMFEGRTGASTIDELYQRTFGKNATDEEKEDIYRQKAALFVQYNDGKPMTGAANVLEKVKEYGLDRVVVTGSGQLSLIDKLECDFPGSFKRDKMITGYDVKYGKPDPEPYYMGLEKAGVTAPEALVIENAPLGVEAGVAAGIFTIAVNTGPLPNQVLLDAGANLLYPNMQSLADDWDCIMKALVPALDAGSH